MQCVDLGGRRIIKKMELNGEVNLSGSKVSAIASLILSTLTSDQFIFHNFPFKNKLLQ